MRRFLTIAAGAILAAGIITEAAAQKAPTAGKAPQAPNSVRDGRGRGFGGSFMKELNLTAAQKTKMEAIQKKQMDQMKAINNQKLTEAERRAKFKAMRDNGNKQIRAILTAPQQKKWDEMMKKMRERMQRGPGGPGGPPGGQGGKPGGGGL